MNSFLATCGSSLYKSSGALKRKIACQPTSIARRQQGQPKAELLCSEAALLSGKVTWHKI